MKYIIIPLFLMGASAFSIFFIDYQDEDEDDGSPINLEARLEVLMTLLLTVAAFQLQIGENLPYKEQTTLIDHYFLMAYFILFVLIWESSLAKVFTDFVHSWDILIGFLCAYLWIMQSLRLVLKWTTYSRFKSRTTSKSWKGSGYNHNICFEMMRYVTCGCSDAFEMCFYVSCPTKCCNFRQKKHERRMLGWLKKEYDESIRWDWGLGKHEKTAELVLGTNWSAFPPPDPSGSTAIQKRQKYIDEGIKSLLND